ncbi:hypothetical protein Tco_1174750 [Tanacetum coccineum]
MKAILDQTLVIKMKTRLDQTLVMLRNLNLNQVMWFLLDQTLNTWTWRPMMLQLNKNLSKWMRIFVTTAYLNVQENLKLPTEDQVILEEPASSFGTLESHEEEPGKTNAEAEVQLMVSVPIHQYTSSVPPMTTPVIDITKSQYDSPLPTSTTTISTIMTTITILPPPPPQPQQSTAYPILVKRIGKLEQHMADLIQNNLALEERLDKQGSRLYNLENLNIPHKVSQAVDEIVTNAVDWAVQAPLRDRFRDLPTNDMKEIL